jgi:hypothetical protein
MNLLLSTVTRTLYDSNMYPGYKLGKAMAMWHGGVPLPNDTSIFRSLGGGLPSDSDNQRLSQSVT